jgi:hypothetical protein
MPAPGIAPNRALSPPGMKPAPPAVKLPPLNLKNSTMMARIGMATFHQVMALLTRENRRMARKLTDTMTAISTMVKMKPAVVTLPVLAL